VSTDDGLEFLATTGLDCLPLPNKLSDMISVITVDDFSYPQGWKNLKLGDDRARWCCSQLEDGQVLLLEHIPFDLPEADLQFLRLQQQSSSPLHKNISYRPSEDKIRGFGAERREDVERLHKIMQNYSGQVVKFLTKFLAPYSQHWKLDFASFRPLEEKGRDLPIHKRNDLLHVDAFPGRPTRGGRILRCFTNINPSEARTWSLGSHFFEIAERYSDGAGLRKIAQGAIAPRSGLRNLVARVGKLVGIHGVERSAYDKLMLSFHDYLKENADYQREGTRIRADFPPSSTWLAFTDAVPHAVLSGRLALEQTLIVPVNALISPEKSPLRKLEQIAGQSLT
jgi:3-deoxy-D-manno-oct-2-ulosonic acid (Kdo) hydroxylase